MDDEHGFVSHFIKILDYILITAASIYLDVSIAASF
jgi:hypothetical protein